MRKDNKVLVSRHFPYLNRARCHQSTTIKHKTPNKISGNRYLHKLNHQLFNNLPNTMNFIRVTIATLNKKSWKNVADVFHDRLNILGKTYKYMPSYLLIIDTIGSNPANIYLSSIEPLERRH